MSFFPPFPVWGGIRGRRGCGWGWTTCPPLPLSMSPIQICEGTVPMRFPFFPALYWIRVTRWPHLANNVSQLFIIFIIQWCNDNIFVYANQLCLGNEKTTHPDPEENRLRVSEDSPQQTRKLADMTDTADIDVGRHGRHGSWQTRQTWKLADMADMEVGRHGRHGSY